MTRYITLLKKASILLALLVLWVVQLPSYAQTLDIMPHLNEQESQQVGDAHEQIIHGTWTVRDNYTKFGKQFNTNQQIVSGIMTRDTLLNYGILVLKRLSQAGIAMGSLMLIYVGYQYILSVITGKEQVNRSLIRNAMIGILVIIFSYAIMRILTRTFLMW